MDTELKALLAELEEKAAAAWAAAKPDVQALLAQAKTDLDNLIAQAVTPPASS